MNPCPCGYLGDRRQACRCSSADLTRYRQRISGPLLDRIDIRIEVPRLTSEELSAAVASEAREGLGAGERAWSDAPQRCARRETGACSAREA